jgi:hypothetical protein
VYGYRKIYDDLQELGERCGKHGRRPAQAVPNRLERWFDIVAPSQV